MPPMNNATAVATTGGDGANGVAPSDHSLDLIEQAMERAKEVIDPMFTSQVGVVLKCKAFARSMVMDALEAMPVPPVPQWANPDKDGKLEDNPNDPEYADAVRRYNYEQARLVMTCYLSFGIDIVTIPEGLPKPEDKSWSDKINLVTKIVIPDSGFMREVLWLRYVALPGEDYDNVYEKVLRMSGGMLREADVSTAATTFRSDEGRDANSGSGVGDETANGNSD